MQDHLNTCLSDSVQDLVDFRGAVQNYSDIEFVPDPQRGQNVLGSLGSYEQRHFAVDDLA